MNNGDIADSVYCVGFACASDLEAMTYKRKIRPPGYKPLVTKWADLPEEDASRRPLPHECSVYSFPQMWGSTATGLGGVGGAAMTTAQTTVVIGPCRDAAVYFGRTLAYHIKKPNSLLIQDIKAHNMQHRHEADRYVV